MQDFWEASSQGSSHNLAALNQGLVNAGTTLPNAYHAAAIALRFNRPCGGGYEAPYCLKEGPDYLATASTPPSQGSLATSTSSYSGTVQNNYALNWINLPTGSGSYNLVLQNTGGGQLRASAVCDTGTTLRVSPFPSISGSGQSTLLFGFDSSGCTAAAAVITNQEQTGANPNVCSSHSYQLTANIDSLPFSLYVPFLTYAAP
jgi:hypothetical protein